MRDFRPSELDALRVTLGARGPSLLTVHGSGGDGVSTLVRRALPPEGASVVWHTAPPLGDADQRALLAGRLAGLTAPADMSDHDLPPAPPAGGVLPAGDAPAEPPAWEDLLEGLRAWLDVGRHPLVLVLDDAHHLLAARSRLPDALAAFWSRVRARALPLHLVLAGRGREGVASLAADGPLAGQVTLDVGLPRVPFRAALQGLEAWSARERLLAWSVFGGHAAALARLDPAVSLATNVRRLVLASDAPFLRHGDALLGSALQSPARYGSVLRALALGCREWGELVAAVSEFGSAGQLAPYLARMEAMGWIEVERSVDAPPRSRSRRYAVSDPFLAFWFRFVPPWRGELEAGEDGAVWSRYVRPELDRHMALHFPRLCREWLTRHGDEVLPGRAREAGGLWGPGYDVEIGATLRTGAACYGRCVWRGPAPGLEAVDALDRTIAATRYGFGRENRIRLVCSAAGFADRLVRRRVRQPEVWLVGPEELVGEGPQGPPPPARAPAPLA